MSRKTSVIATKQKPFRSFLKTIPFVPSIKRYLWRKKSFTDFLYGKDGQKGFTKLNILRTFPLFKPLGGGSYQDIAQLTIQTINQTIPFLSSLAASVSSRKINITHIQNFSSSSEDLEAAHKLKKYLDSHGSDKANIHNYHHLYGPILKHRDKITGVFEIGLGTNNTDVLSSMGTEGKPGASIRAFREFLKNAQIYGADIDKTILFNEERIETFFVDQTDPTSFDKLEASMPFDLDLGIDDGLHSPDANIATLKFGINRIKIGGWVVIEDIGSDAIPLWQIVAALLPDKYQPYLFDARGGILFAVQRLS